MKDVKTMYAIDQALINFSNMKKSIKGLFEILKINIPEKDLYFKMGVDNIEALYQNFIELLLNEDGTKEFIKKLKNSEIDVDIPLGSVIRTKR